jgi:hypothetical protein
MSNQKMKDDASLVENDAHQIALELLKQIITLASGILAISATFIQQFSASNKLFFIILIIAWINLVISIFSALITISAIVKSRLDNNDDWSSGTGKKSAQISQTCFLIGIIFFGIFALILIFFSPNQQLGFLTKQFYKYK